MNGWEVGKLRVAAESKSAEAAAAVQQFGHDHPKSKDAVRKASSASAAYREALS